MIESKYILVSILAGVFTKLYDDINDNELLIEYKKNKFLTEILKGLTIISITGLSLQYPLYFLTLFLVVIVQYFVDKTGPYKDPYEKSLLVSMLFMFLLFDYKKLKMNKLWNSIQDFSTSRNTIVLVIIAIIGFSIFEGRMMKQEVSYAKLYTRIILIIYCMFVIYVLPETFDGIKLLCYYLIGYFTVSIIIQYNSLQTLHQQNHPEKLESL